MSEPQNVEVKHPKHRILAWKRELARDKEGKPLRDPATGNQVGYVKVHDVDRKSDIRTKEGEVFPVKHGQVKELSPELVAIFKSTGFREHWSLEKV